MPVTNAFPSSSFSSFSSTAGQRVEDVSTVNSSPPARQTASSPGPAASENEKHPKAKRKRTAAKDKTILEAAYKANPKPDKTARLELVQQVSLNEKEVQIWFQNRRQNDRRKSRPLSTQEIAALRSGGMQVLSSDPVTSSSQLDDGTSLMAEQSPASTPGRRSLSGPSLSQDGPFRHTAQEQEQESSVHAPEMTEVVTDEKWRQAVPQESHSDPQKMPMFPNPAGYLSNRWNLSSSFSTPATLGQSGDTLRLDPLSSSPPLSSAAPVHPPTQSNVRISLSLEGKAEVVSNDDSPPRPRAGSNLSAYLPRSSRAVPRGSLNRSQSAVLNVTLPPISTLTNALPPSLSRGRSRDAQAWEFCCDSDKRDELTAQAENESTGSAVAAISLLRSSSNVLQPSASKRNAPPLKHSSRPSQGKKPRLSRTMSSNAVMQKGLLLDTDMAAPPSPRLKSSKHSVFPSPSGGDSDKENVSPNGDDEAPRNHPRQVDRQLTGQPRAANPRRQGRMLQAQKAPMMLVGSRANTAPLMHRRDSGKGLEIFEDAEDRLPKTGSRSDEEVEKFMRGEVSPSKKGDMDCIAGLLSLSQGNWR